MSATFVLVAWISVRMLFSVYAQDKLQWQVKDGDFLLTDSSGIASELRQENIKSRYPYFSNYLHARAGTHIPDSMFRNRGVPPIIHQSSSKATHYFKRSSGKQQFYPSYADGNYVFIGNDEPYGVKRSLMGCDMTQMTIQNIIEYLRRRRVCGIKAAQLRFGTGGRK